MILYEKVVGKRICLRTAEPEDAEFILSLRLDDRLNEFLKETDPSIERQRKWIEEKKSASNDYHMIIEGRQSDRYGVVAVYDISKNHFRWGRWIVEYKAPLYVAYESMNLVYNFGFNILNRQKAIFEVQIGNVRVIQFHEGYGARIVLKDEHFVHFEYLRKDFVRK